MKTEYVGGNRTILKNALPLAIPFTLDVSMVQGVCNLKCGYCEQAADGFGTGIEYLSLSLMKKIIREMKDSKWLLKQILLGGGWRTVASSRCDFDYKSNHGGRCG